MKKAPFGMTANLSLPVMEVAFITRKNSKRNKKPLWERTQSG
jgi:hypothetical protein